MNAKAIVPADTATISGAIEDRLSDLRGNGLNASVANTQVDEGGEVTMVTLKVAAVGPNGEVGQTMAERKFRQFAPMFDLDPDWLGKSFRHKRHTFTIDGLNPNAPKNPVTAIRDDGKTFVMHASMVQTCMKESKL